MNEFSLIKKYLRPLSLNNSGSFNLSDDIYYDFEKKIAISVDAYVEGKHFVGTEPKHFIQKVLRSSLSDLYCKGIKPKFYLLSISLSKKIIKNDWLKKVKNILIGEQNKFNIFLAGGDTVYSSKLMISVTVLGYSKNKPILRSGAHINDDIYVTGNIGDSFIGLNVLKKKFNFNRLNNFFKKKYYQPNLPIKITPYLKKIASASIDISDGLGQDLNHLCKASNCGAIVDLNSVPLSPQSKYLVKKNKLIVKNIFSNGDDYQILFTSNQKNRITIKRLSKKIGLKVTKIGTITKDLNIYFKCNNEYFKPNMFKMGHTHTF